MAFACCVPRRSDVRCKVCALQLSPWSAAPVVMKGIPPTVNSNLGSPWSDPNSLSRLQSANRLEHPRAGFDTAR